MIKIWGRNTSSNVQKAMWAVGELKLKCERIDVGGNIFAQSVTATKHYGRLVTLLKIAPEVDLSTARLRNQSIGFVLVLSPLIFNLASEQSRQRGILEQASMLVADGKLRTHIHKTYPLAQARDAQVEVAKGSTTGKVVLEIG